MTPHSKTAEQMAKNAGIPAKKFRKALRNDELIKKHGWHNHYARWTVQCPGPESDDMDRVLKKLIN